MYRRSSGVPARRPALAVAAVAAALTLAGCSGGATSSPARAESPPAGSAAQTPAGADVAFVRGMTPHHDQALQMTALAPDRTSTPAVRALAAEISAAQQPEIATMRRWLSVRGLPPTDDAHSMSGMLDPAALDRLAASRGAAFDRLFLEQMIAHHTGALEMARTEVGTGRDPQMVALARGIVTSQQSEIDRMRAILESA